MQFNQEGFSQERSLSRKQEKQMPLSRVAEGYSELVEKIFDMPIAPAIRNEVNAHRDAVTKARDLEEQSEALQALVKALDGYTSIFAEVPSDPAERAAFALALINSPKGKQ